ncbi:hypothetical protein BGW37DRAFT_523044 [Umbelopsis sp. PMI_123]|nr:hypothetical protein BGW37DRAFT_523044 [Umbelopsis sp. PMI_123]
MGQQRKRPAAGLPSNRPKQAKISENENVDIDIDNNCILVVHDLIAQADNSQSTTNDLFNDLDEEMPLDANEDAEDQFSLSDNEKMAEDEHDGTESKSLLDTPDIAKRFRDFYITQLTQAFPNDLDKIRQEENFDDRKLEILIDSLEAGVDIFSDMEKSFAIMSS